MLAHCHLDPDVDDPRVSDFFRVPQAYWKSLSGAVRFAEARKLQAEFANDLTLGQALSLLTGTRITAFGYPNLDLDGFIEAHAEAHQYDDNWCD